MGLLVFPAGSTNPLQKIFTAPTHYKRLPAGCLYASCYEVLQLTDHLGPGGDKEFVVQSAIADPLHSKLPAQMAEEDYGTRGGFHIRRGVDSFDHNY